MTAPRHDTYAEIADDLATRPKARRDGDGWRIPCPHHGGPESDANAHIWPREDGTIGATCFSAGCSYADILAGLGLDTRRDQWTAGRQRSAPSHARTASRARTGAPEGHDQPESTAHGRTDARRPTTRPARQTAASADYARALWARSSAADGTPAAHYLAQRRVWPDDVPCPPSVRWLAREALRADVDGKWLGKLRRRADFAGLVLAAYRLAGQPRSAVQAVEVDAVSAGGRLLDPRFRRTYGQRRGAAFTARSGRTGGPVHVCEGYLTALALTWLAGRDELVLAAGGTGNLAPVLLAGIEPPRAVHVHADNDTPGRRAAYALAKTLRADGDCVTVHTCEGNGPAGENGRDAADVLRDLVDADGWEWLLPREREQANE